MSADGSSYLIPQIFPDRVIEYDGSTLQKRPPLYNAMSATSGGMLNPAGTRLAVLAGTWLRIFNTATRAQVFERNLKFDRPFGSANTVAYSPDGSTLFLVVTKEPATDPRLLAIPAVPKQATLTVSGPRHAAYGATARITVHLAGGSSTNRRVRLYMQPSNKPRTLVRNVKVNAAGNLLYSAKLTRRTVFTAEWDGDAAYFSERSARTVTVGALMRTALSGFYRKAGAYHLYHRGAKPVFAARVLPATPSKQGERVQFVLERHANGAWHRVGAKVVRMSQQNIAAVRLIGFGVGDYRIRAVFRGDSLNTSTPSRFSFLRITN